jgi:hypothetical protein
MLKTKKLKTKPGQVQTYKAFTKDISDHEEPVLDLCSTCNHKDNCTLSSTSSIVYHCEEFDDSTQKQDTITIPEHSVKEDKIHNEQHMGLCVNCIHRDTCSLSKMEGGVWHCEEYE